MTLRLCLLLLLSVCLSSAFAQSIQREVIATAGGVGTTGGVTLESNIGEFFIETYTGSPDLLTQGFLQPDTLLSTVVAEVHPDAPGIAYPNPVAGKLYINLGIENERGLQIGIIDVLGAVHAAGFVYSGNGTYEIDFSNFSAGVYFVRVQSAVTGYSNVFKISRM